MSHSSNHSNPADICLMLRAHAEELWLTAEVLPVVREVERPGSIPEEQLGAALAYLEVLWLGARRRAAGTDAAMAALLSAHGNRADGLQGQARSLHAAVCAKRDALARRVQRLLAPPNGASREHEHATI